MTSACKNCPYHTKRYGNEKHGKKSYVWWCCKRNGTLKHEPKKCPFIEE